MVDPRNFFLNTDNPLDKVVYLNQGSMIMGSGMSVDIPHGLPYTPLISFIWSFTADFAITYQENNGPFPSGNPGYFFSLQVSSQSNPTNVRLSGNGTITSTTIYYRILAFVPDDYVGNLPSTTTQADKFVLLTDLNYAKLVKVGTISVAASGTATIPHNLGYLPQVMVWSRPSTGVGVYPLQYESPYNCNADITTSALVLTNLDFNATTVFYRVYADV